jgi:DnaJ-class molecular chaperone
MSTWKVEVVKSTIYSFEISQDKELSEEDAIFAASSFIDKGLFELYGKEKGSSYKMTKLEKTIDPLTKTPCFSCKGNGKIKYNDPIIFVDVDVVCKDCKGLGILISGELNVNENV